MKRWALSFILVALIPAACLAMDDVAIQLKWYHSTQFAGVYAAAENGLFAEQGIEVSIFEGTKELDEVEFLLSGGADFAIVSGSEVLRRRSEEGAPIVAIAVVYQISPSVYFSKVGKGIVTPPDMAGRTVLVYGGDEILPALLAQFGLTVDDVVPVSPRGISMDAFYNDEVDVWTGYLTDQVLAARDAGYELNVLFPSDYGIHVYADTVIATERMIEENPDLVERFLRALLAGWEWVVAHPEQAGEQALLYDDGLALQHQIDQMVASIPLIVTSYGRIGTMSEATWQGMHDMLVAQGLMEATDVASAYTTQFLEAIYDGE